MKKILVLGNVSMACIAAEMLARNQTVLLVTSEQSNELTKVKPNKVIPLLNTTEDFDVKLLEKPQSKYFNKPRNNFKKK